MEDVKSRGPFVYSVLESAQAFLAQHPFQEPEETLTEGKGPLLSYSLPTAIPAKESQNNKLPGVNARVHVVGSLRVKLDILAILAMAPSAAVTIQGKHR